MGIADRFITALTAPLTKKIQQVGRQTNPDRIARKLTAPLTKKSSQLNMRQERRNRRK